MFQALDSLSLQLAAERRLETLRVNAGAPKETLRRRLGRALVDLGSRLAPEEAPARRATQGRMRPAPTHR
ncbi:MAG TPA: hypothetical protein VFH63_04065 [candidate division Zixibacteria bacterium]|nr:hypothetical protein [candidate division Zixibacteria bacterium]